MRTFVRLGRASLISFVVAGMGGMAGVGAAAAEPLGVTCTRSWPEARYRPYGYDHLVHVQNNCKRPVDCAVSTDVNPQVQRVRVAVGEEAVVSTFLGSPATAFVPRVDCQLVP